ncbi:HAMP domain-containing histidine kinase [Actinotalea sp. M2MS4P-6]|uniref:sensor histidine kinase n=1 Tax=Actinotalea sp. M2MS4P-6 TaxID=2983762 RepID=UPI0021E41251|nr:HAMP domain-containing sensor histidine kinase [Actinotalea sp. M2MS4P-6]MCV2394919.1 HAMP domain-containing histidine kinase [Actinotalea sp. M2MS4P-6]
MRISIGPSRRAPLRRRLVLVVLGAVAVVAATMAAISTFALRSSLVAQLDQRLVQSADRATKAESALPGVVPPDGSTGTPPNGDGSPPVGLVALGQGAGTLTVAVRGTDVQSGYLDQTGTVHELDAEQQATLLDVTPSSGVQTVSLGDLGQWRVIAFDNRDGTVITGLSMTDISTTVDTYLLTEATIALAGLLIAALAGTVLVRRELEPLERVAATATRVSEQPLDRGAVTLDRVPEQDTDTSTEVGQVGVALNRLLGHVESALAARHESEMQVRQFVADASHELRTPLASIRGYAELVQRLPEPLPDDAVRAMERVESESRRMTTLVEDLLLLARLDAGRALDRDEVDMVGLAVDAVADAHVAGRDHVWRLDLGDGDVLEDTAGGPTDDGASATTTDDGTVPEAVTEDLDFADPEPALVLGDDHRLRQVLVNLLANARVHTPPGTTVTTSVRVEGDQVVVRVCDDGPGIAPELLPRLFQRFTRGDAARTPMAGRDAGAGSTGLGLAIVHAVVAAHGGQIEVDGTPGATTFTVRLPAVGEGARADEPTSARSAAEHGRSAGTAAPGGSTADPAPAEPAAGDVASGANATGEPASGEPASGEPASGESTQRPARTRS